MRAARFAAAALALAAFALPPARADLTDAVTVRVASGQPYEGFIIDAGDCHAFLIEDFGLQSFSISLKAAKGSTLLPDITFHDPSDVDITSSLDPFRNDGAKSVKVKNASFTGGEGRHVLRVLGKDSTTGGYVLKVTAKVVKKFKGTGLVETGGGIDTVSFFVPTEATVKVKAVPASGSTLAPFIGGAVGNPCVQTFVLSDSVGNGTFSSPLSSVYDVEVVGDAGTAGAFNWSAKVKAAKPSRKAVRVNGGAAYVAAPGPGVASKLIGAGQSANGFATDGVELCWREVRTSGGGGNLGRNSITCSTATGNAPRNVEGNLATDETPPDHALALGGDYVAVAAAGELWLVYRYPGGSTTSLDAAVGAVGRVLVNFITASTLLPDRIDKYDLPAGSAQSISMIGGAVYRDMAHGGRGIVYAVEVAGDLEIRTMTIDGGDDELLTSFSPDPGFLALTARGAEAYVAVVDGDGTQVFRTSACDPGNRSLVGSMAGGPARCMAADELNVYVAVDAEGGTEVAQVARGGGEPVSIVRSDVDNGFSIDDLDLAAAGGYVYFLADDGAATFYRVKRR